MKTRNEFCPLRNAQSNTCGETEEVREAEEQGDGEQGAEVEQDDVQSGQGIDEQDGDEHGHDSVEEFAVDVEEESTSVPIGH